ncbi:MAG: RnfABCDGE type electron transport complex subunit D [Coriobacteriia bacterium]|nr:RnfABCDGE type electron transport complex subunit D [Coriobacteriia bacterium]
MLKASPNPLVKDSDSTARIMLIVCLSMIPNIIAGFLIFGYRALILYAVSVLTCVLSEHVSCMLMKKESTIKDFSAVVTGLLFAALLPVGTPLYMVIFGAIVAIVVVKMVFGGIGYNFANPAIAARIVLIIAFPATMANYAVLPQYAQGSPALSADVSNLFADTVTSATPMALLNDGAKLDLLGLFLGTHSGSIGEVSMLAILIGAAILLIFGVIDLWIPLFYIGSTLVFALLLGSDPLYNLMSGGLMLGAWYMANDYTTSPLTKQGKIVYAIGCGLITALVRVVGFASEGVAFAILFMNLLTPLLDKVFITKPLGGVKRFNAR